MQRLKDGLRKLKTEIQSGTLIETGLHTPPPLPYGQNSDTEFSRTRKDEKTQGRKRCFSHGTVDDQSSSHPLPSSRCVG